jgi:hypothetical protein
MFKHWSDTLTIEDLAELMKLQWQEEAYLNGTSGLAVPEKTEPLPDIYPR